MGKKRELVKNTAIITVGKLCTQFLSFFLLPVYTAVLSTSEYGTFDLLMVYQQLIGYVAFFQIEQALFRFLIEVRGKRKETTEIVSSCFAFASLQSIVLAVIFFLVKWLTGFEYALYLYIYVLAVILSGLMLQVARGFGRNSIYAVGSFISALSAIVFNILFLVVFHLGIKGMITAYILGNFLCSIFVFCVLKLWQYIKMHDISVSSVKRCVGYSIPLVPNALSWWIMSASDRTIVGVMLGTSFNGLLTVAHKFSTAYTSFYTVFNLSWTESASLHINDSDADKFFRNVIHSVYRIFSAVAIGIIAVMPFVFSVLVNQNYADAYYQIPIYMIASLCQAFQGMYSVIYVALKKTKEIAKSTTMCAVINIVVNLSMIRSIGLYAASLSTLVAYLVLSIWRYVDLKKYMDVTFDKKLLISSVTVLTVVCISYYSKIKLACFGALILAITYAIVINRDVIVLIIKSPRQLMKLVKK